MPKFAANLSMMFNELPFLDRFAAAADAGFNAVEFLFPYDYPADLLAENCASMVCNRYCSTPRRAMSVPASGGWRRCRAASRTRGPTSIVR
ncbi:Hydroxypyruvate isomerase [Serratia odorifera]|uniref:Hydroxypyruvate isomerase n=1 Tax=Serratia odorifera TaxID=618 RepID=A0A447L264_SEROD|nr:Hydroxypyruvate isomerase [Serratia odorifera]